MAEKTSKTRSQKVTDSKQEEKPKTLADSGAVIKNCDMKEDMQKFAVESAVEGIQQHSMEKDIAAYIKKAFDQEYRPTWHCIVGRNFGSYVTHEVNHFIYFYIGQIAILLFKSG